MELPATGNKVRFGQIRGQLPPTLSVNVRVTAVCNRAAGDHLKQLITSAKAEHRPLIE
jgi:hypothetical protein